MKWLKELLDKFNVSEEVVTSILDETKDKQFVPHSRLQDEIEKRKNLETEIATRDKQIKDLGKYATDNEVLKKELNDLKANNDTWNEKYQALQLDTAIKLSITDAHNVDTVLKLMSRDGLALADDGSVKGLDEALKGLKEQHSYLFKAEQEPTQQQEPQGLKGRQPNVPGTQLTKRQQLEKQLESAPSLVERISIQRQISELQE